jgi:hypothetical protein
LELYSNNGCTGSPATQLAGVADGPCKTAPDTIYTRRSSYKVTFGSTPTSAPTNQPGTNPSAAASLNIAATVYIALFCAILCIYFAVLC